jgi:pimeloyl-ACP methyl ester carboxylesterase
MTDARMGRGALAATVVFMAAVWPPLSAKGQSEERRAPEPVDLAVTTKDHVRIRFTYYASTAGQDAVPVVMLHDFNETRAVFAPLARSLQNPRPPADETTPPIGPRAVVTVDLRGHGESKTAYALDGTALELDANRFRQQDFLDMVRFDLEAVRRFLVEQNDAGQLNLNKMCVVGSGMGANVAVLWAAQDWAMPPLAARKQGQDVKALALISPRWNFRGLMLRDAFRFPPIQRQLSVFLAYGRADRDVVSDIDNMRKVLDRFHPEPPADQVLERKDYFVYAPDTILQGTKLLNSGEFDLGRRIADFIELWLGRKPFPYIQRKRP